MTLTPEQRDRILNEVAFMVTSDSLRQAADVPVTTTPQPQTDSLAEWLKRKDRKPVE